MAVDTEHWGVLPSTIADAMVAALQTYVFNGSSGFIRHTARIESTSEADIKRACALGLPALLVYHQGTKYGHRRIEGRQYEGVMTFRILACAGSFLTKVRRLGGDATIDYTAITDPKEVGVEEIAEWGAYLAMRAVLETDGTYRHTLVESIPGELIDSGLYVGAVDMLISRQVDLYGDLTGNTLESVGLVHSPDDEDTLWTDPPTDSSPNTSDWGDGVDGGHFQLEDS